MTIQSDLDISGLTLVRRKRQNMLVFSGMQRIFPNIDTVFYWLPSSKLFFPEDAGAGALRPCFDVVIVNDKSILM